MQRNVQETVRILRRVERLDPDLVEIRFDRMTSSPTLSKIRDATDHPLIATNRRRNQGGLFSGTEDARVGTLTQAALNAFDYVDIELNTRNAREAVRRLKQHGAEVIVSYHNKNSTPSQNALESILKREKLAGADVCKIVGTAKSYSDSLRSLVFTNKHAKRTKLVCFSMGRLGIPSRVLSPIFGAYFTFASSSSGQETGSGQIPIQKLRALYEEFGLA